MPDGCRKYWKGRSRKKKIPKPHASPSKMINYTQLTSSIWIWMAHCSCVPETPLIRKIFCGLTPTALWLAATSQSCSFSSLCKTYFLPNWSPWTAVSRLLSLQLGIWFEVDAQLSRKCWMPHKYLKTIKRSFENLRLSSHRAKKHSWNSLTECIEKHTKTDMS